MLSKSRTSITYYGVEHHTFTYGVKPHSILVMIYNISETQMPMLLIFVSMRDKPQFQKFISISPLLKLSLFGNERTD